MSKNGDTMVVACLSGVAMASVSYVVAVKSMGFKAFCMWKLGAPVALVVPLTGTAIVVTAAAGMVVGGSVYYVAKAIGSHKPPAKTT